MQRKHYLKRSLLAALVAFSAASVTPATADTPPYPAQLRPGFMTGNSSYGTDIYFDFLIPVAGADNHLFFLNPNLRFDDRDGNEQNIGFGYRRMSDCGHFIFGGNLFFDTMLSRHSERYKQWGLGAEVLSQWVDFRANYYYPVGDKEKVIGGGGTTGEYYFEGNSLLVSGGVQMEQALDGYDAEVSVLIPGISNIMETRAAATYYKFDVDNGEDVDGLRSRLEIRPVKALNLSVEYRDDDVRGSDTFFGGFLELPFSFDNLIAGKNPFEGAGDLWAFGSGSRPLKDRMTEKVVRDRHIVTTATEEQGGGSGQAVVDNKMIFVNQDNESEGDGSYENPYQSLESATEDDRYIAGAWIYVFSSDDTADSYYNTNITLLDDMVFWGQGYTHPVYGLGGGNNPILDGGGNGVLPVITLANDNEIMGFTIQKGEEGIRGANIQNANIHDNIIRVNGGYASGIHIDNNWSADDVSGKTLLYQFVNNQVLDNAGDGIYVLHTINGTEQIENTSIENLFTNNTVQGNGNYGVFSRIRIYTQDENSSITGSSFRNAFIDNEIGGDEEGEGNGYDGIRTDMEIYTNDDASPISNTSLVSWIENNDVIGNNGDGIDDDYLSVYTGGANSGISNVTITRYITDNEIRNNSYDGYQNDDTTARTYGSNSPIEDSTISNQFSNNTISGNGEDAIYMWGSRLYTYGTSSSISRSTITNDFTQNQIEASAARYDGIKIYTNNIRTSSSESPLTDVSINNNYIGNTIDGAEIADNGIDIESNNTYILALNPDSPISNAQINNTFEDNTVTNFTGDGIRFSGNYIHTGSFMWDSGDGTNSPISGSSINNTLINNVVCDNGGRGTYNWRNEIKAYPASVSDSSTNNIYTGNTVERNGDEGIYLDEDFGGGSNTSMNYSFTNNIIRDNGLGLYMYIDPSNGDLIDKNLFLQGNTITGNFSYGVEVYVNGEDTNDFDGDFGGGPLGSTGGNTFSGNSSYDIYHRGDRDMDIWALDNFWTNTDDPESNIYDNQDSVSAGDIITSQGDI